MKRLTILALVAELHGEGETRLHVARFALSRDGRTLSDLQSEPALVRYRCKLARGARPQCD